jgi:hypothetical protein
LDAQTLAPAPSSAALPGSVFDAAAAGEPPRRKAGRSAWAVAKRRKLFVEAYLSNGHNAAQAAIAAGTGGKQPRAEGWKLLHHPEVQHLIATRAERVAELAEMNTATWARELRAVAFSDIGKLFDGDGKLIPVPHLPAHVRAAISSVKVHTTKERATIVEYKFWDKCTALQTMARHLGLFERDTAQTKQDIHVRVELVG